jgi:hypothetical protein
LAAATTKSRWSGSLASKRRGVGGRFGPDQNGAPDAVTMSSGNVWMS